MADGIFKPESKTIREIFCDSKSFYQVPDYQRPYSWKEEQVDQLWEDIHEAYLANKENPEVNQEYFLGSLILIPTDDAFDVVDGQQRLTTLMILFCTIRDLYPEINETDSNIGPDNIDICELNEAISQRSRRPRLRLKTGVSKQNLFKSSILDGIEWPKGRWTKSKAKKNRYLNTALIFKHKLEHEIEPENRGDFLNYIFRSVRLITISCSNQAFAIKLFQVLNTRGLELNTSDLVKSLLLSKIEEDDHPPFLASWGQAEKMIEDLEDIKASDMWTYYLFYLTNSQVKRSLYEEIEAAIKHRESNEVIQEFKTFTECFHEIYNTEDKDLYPLWYLSHQQYWRSILTTAKFEEYHNFNGLVQSLSRFYYLYWIAGYSAFRIKQVSLNMIDMVKRDLPLSDIESAMELKLASDGVIERVKMNLAEDCYKSKGAKPLLTLIEYHQVDKSNQQFIYLDKSIHVEHILPQENQTINEWKEIFSFEEADKYVNRIENLTLLSGTKNISASNYPFSQKLKIYHGKGKDGKTSFRITQYIKDNYEEWTPETLANRRTWILENLSEIFEIDLTESKKQDKAA